MSVIIVLPYFRAVIDQEQVQFFLIPIYGISIGIAFTKRFWVGLFGSECIILKKCQGTAISSAFIQKIITGP